MKSLGLQQSFQTGICVVTFRYLWMAVHSACLINESRARLELLSAYLDLIKHPLQSNKTGFEYELQTYISTKSTKFIEISRWYHAVFRIRMSKDISFRSLWFFHIVNKNVKNPMFGFLIGQACIFISVSIQLIGILINTTESKHTF